MVRVRCEVIYVENEKKTAMYRSLKNTTSDESTFFGINVTYLKFSKIAHCCVCSCFAAARLHRNSTLGTSFLLWLHYPSLFNFRTSSFSPNIDNYILQLTNTHSLHIKAVSSYWSGAATRCKAARLWTSETAGIKYSPIIQLRYAYTVRWNKYLDGS